MSPSSQATVLKFTTSLDCDGTKHLFEMHTDHSGFLSQDSLVTASQVGSCFMRWHNQRSYSFSFCGWLAKESQAALQSCFAFRTSSSHCVFLWQVLPRSVALQFGWRHRVIQALHALSRTLSLHQTCTCLLTDAYVFQDTVWLFLCCFCGMCIPLPHYWDRLSKIRSNLVISHLWRLVYGEGTSRNCSSL